jgi:hypothetical protein
VSGGETHQARSALQEGRCIAVYISQHFKPWHFDKHFYIAVFKAVFMNVLILVDAVLT